MAAQRLSAWLSLWLALAASGCADSDCVGVEVAPCDIDDARCQRSVLTATACERGERVPPPPPMRVISQAQYREELNESVVDDDRGPTPWDTAYALLGWLAPDTDSTAAEIDERVQSVAAYYDPRHRDITIIDAERPDDVATRTYVLAHELTHYLQDLRYGLGRLSKRIGSGYDAGLARDALVEGDAVVTSGRIYAQLRRWDGLDWPGYFDALEESTLDSIAGSPAPLFVARSSLAYVAGGRRIAQLWEQRGRASVASLYAKPYVRFVDWLSPPFTSSARTLTAGEEDLACAPPLAPEGLVLYGFGSMGPAGLIALRAADGGDLAEGSQVRGDALAVYADSPSDAASASPVAVAWRVRFDSPAHALAMAQKLEVALPSAVSIAQHGQELLLTASDTPALRFSQGALEACPTLDALLAAPDDSETNAAGRVRLRPQRLLARAGGFEPP